jgi:haloacetate dehalogenase
MDTVDKDKKVATPTLILWGARGPERSNEFIDVWRKYVPTAQGEGLQSGHYMPEEVPDQLYDRFTRFFTA